MTDILRRTELGVDAAPVLHAAADALRAAAERLDLPTFDRAVEVLADCPGEVGVVGVGPSGFLANHVAATLAARGIAATCLPPSEAGLGSLTGDDVVLAVGAETELAAMAPALGGLRQRDVLVIAVTDGAPRSVAGAADLALETGAASELGTLVTAALGEALALAIAAVRDGA